MVEIKGKLSDLFKSSFEEFTVELTEELLESMINRPIIKNYKCVGIIKHADKDKDEWSGFLFDTVSAGLSSDKKQCVSVELLNL